MMKHNHMLSSLIQIKKSNVLTAVQIVYNIILMSVNYHQNHKKMFINVWINVLQTNHSNKVYTKEM